jgi:hypothetical protein
MQMLFKGMSLKKVVKRANPVSKERVKTEPRHHKWGQKSP